MVVAVVAAAVVVVVVVVAGPVVVVAGLVVVAVAVGGVVVVVATVVVGLRAVVPVGPDALVVNEVVPGRVVEVGARVVFGARSALVVAVVVLTCLARRVGPLCRCRCKGVEAVVVVVEASLATAVRGRPARVPGVVRAVPTVLLTGRLPSGRRCCRARVATVAAALRARLVVNAETCRLKPRRCFLAPVLASGLAEPGRRAWVGAGPAVVAGLAGLASREEKEVVLAVLLVGACRAASLAVALRTACLKDATGWFSAPGAFERREPAATAGPNFGEGTGTSRARAKLASPLAVTATVPAPLTSPLAR
jgi:hypothetical protein